MEDLFTNRPPTQEQAEMLDEITRQMLNVSDCLHLLPPSRFRSLALTNLEQTSMWAKKATVFTFGVETTDAEGAARVVTDRLMGSGGVDPE
jgi:DNA-binding PucR family transcriptional regulator